MENQINKAAIIIGATGLVGNNLLKILLDDSTFQTIKIFVRNTTGISNPKLEEHVINFEELEKYKEKITGDVLFSCLGTTLKQAGGKEGEFKVDYTYQYNFAKISSNNKVRDYVLVSSPGANKKSMFFYTRIKGQLEDAVSKLNFETFSFIRPSVLVGQRKIKRKNEEVSAKIIDGISRVIPPLRKYSSIKGETVAKAMLNIYNSPKKERITIYELGKIKEFV